jgi:hypothetical protein
MVPEVTLQVLRSVVILRSVGEEKNCENGNRTLEIEANDFGSYLALPLQQQCL